MAEEPDGGRDRDSDWTDLTPAVRRAEPRDGSRGERRVWSELTPAVRRVDDGPGADATPDAGDATPDDGTDTTADDADAPAGDGDAGLSRVDRDGWRDLTPAVERVEGRGDDRAWNDDGIDTASPQSVDPAAGGEPKLLADDDHQADGADADATGEEGALDPRENDAVHDEPSPPDDLETPGDDLGMSAPETDVEQPLAVHVEEMVKRLGIVIAIAGLVSLVVFPFTESLITTIWNYVLPGGEAVDPRVYNPLELIITQLKVASLAGLVIALPVFVYESYAFMRPGLYRNERRYYLAAVPTSLVLAVLGVAFAYLLVLPYTMDYFQGYTETTANVAFALGTTFNLILMVMGYLAVVFQIPLFIMLAIMLGVTTREWLEGRRLLFWAAFAGISFTFGAIDPTGVVPLIVALTMIALFEGTLALLRWTGN